MTKFLLAFLIFICSVSGLYSAYLLFNDDIEPITGAILTSACVLVFVWCLSLLKKHRLRGSSIFWVFIIAVLLLSTTVAYAGVEPMSGAKDKITTWIDTETSKITAPTQSTQTTEDSKPSVPTKTSTTGLVGKWRDTKTNQTIEFFKDGRLVFDDGQYMISGTYKLIGNEYIQVALEGLAGAFAAMSAAETWKYQISGDTLNIVAAGKTATLKRVR